MIEDLHRRTLNPINALYNKISENLESLPNIIDESGYPQEVEELKVWHEEKKAICLWKVRWKVGKVRTNESPKAHQWDVYPKGMEHSNLLPLLDDISQ